MLPGPAEWDVASGTKLAVLRLIIDLETKFEGDPVQVGQRLRETLEGSRAALAIAAKRLAKVQLRIRCQTARPDGDRPELPHLLRLLEIAERQEAGLRERHIRLAMAAGFYSVGAESGPIPQPHAA